MKSFNMLLICFDWNVIFINSSYFKPLDSISLLRITASHFYLLNSPSYFKPLDSISLLRITASHFYLLNSFSGMKDSLYLILSSDDFIRYFYKIFKFHFWLFKISSISPDFTFGCVQFHLQIPDFSSRISDIGIKIFFCSLLLFFFRFCP